MAAVPGFPTTSLLECILVSLGVVSLQMPLGRSLPWWLASHHLTLPPVEPMQAEALRKRLSLEEKAFSSCPPPLWVEWSLWSDLSPKGYSQLIGGETGWPSLDRGVWVESAAYSSTSPSHLYQNLNHPFASSPLPAAPNSG